MNALEMAYPTSEVIQQLEEKVTYFCQRDEITPATRAQLERLKAQYAHVKERIQKMILIYMPDLAGQETLNQFTNTFKQDLDKLSSCEQTLQNVESTDGEHRTEQILSECEQNMKEFSDFMAHGTAISAFSRAQPSQQEVFVSCIEVPVNPPRLTLDYNTATTNEGRLRAAVLGESESRIIAVVGSDKGGVGKTTALRGLAVDSEVIQKFPGGMFFINLANERGQSNIVKKVAHLVKRTGGLSTAKMIDAETSIQKASEKASDWFEGHACLFLVDASGSVTRSGSDVLTALLPMLNESSRLVYTTRQKHENRAETVVEFEKLEAQGDLARRMLKKHAEFGEDEELEQRNKNVLDAILSMCQGLPLALGIAGGSVRKNASVKVLEHKQDAWSQFQHDVLSLGEAILDPPTEHSRLLPKLIDVSLHVLELLDRDKQYSKHFRALCVLKRRHGASLYTLQKLWNLNSVEDAMHLVSNFAEVSLMHVIREGGSISVYVHDLVHKVAIRKASERRESQRFFQDFIRHYSPRIGINEAVGEWWNLEDDGYVHDNVCRILRNAGNVEEMVNLLSKPQWITHRLTHNGLSAVELDLNHGISVTATVSHGQSTRLEHLQALLMAAKLSHPYVSKNPREVWFQMHGRLLWHSTQNILTKTFVEEIERCAPRPWAKASLGLLVPAETGVHTLQVPGFVRCVSLEHEEVWVMWGGSYGSLSMGVSCQSSTTGALTTRSLDLDEQLRESVGFVRAAAFLPNGNLVTAHEGLKLVLWDRETAEMKQVVDCADNSVLGFLRSHWPFRSKEEFITLGAYGSRAASTSESRHTVQVWDTETGNAVGPQLTGHSDTVWSASFSNSGLRVATGSYDGTARVWDTRSGSELTRVRVRGRDQVMCVALSGDGCRLAAATNSGTVQVWDAVSGRLLTEEPLRLRGYAVWMTLSAEGSRLVSSALDGKTRVWDVSGGNAQMQQPVWQWDQHSCVALSGDGARVASGGRKGVVRIWSARGRETKWARTTGHVGWVSSVVVSGDGTRVVSGSSDRTVRVWDARTGELAGPVMEHEGANVERLAVDSRCERIVSEGFLWLGGQQMWDVPRGVRMMTWLDEGWEQTLAAMELSWSSTANLRRIAGGALTEEEDSGTVVLATFESPMWMVTGAEFCYSEFFETCSVVR